MNSRVIKIAKRTKKIAYAIRDIDVLEGNGGSKLGRTSVLKLNIGDPLLFDFKIPAVMRKANSERDKQQLQQLRGFARLT